MPITIQGPQRNLSLTAPGSKEAGPASPFYHPWPTNSRNLPAPEGTAIQRSTGVMRMLFTSATAQGATWAEGTRLNFFSIQATVGFQIIVYLCACMHKNPRSMVCLCASMFPALRLSRDKAHTCIQSQLWLPNTKVSDYDLKNIFSGNWAVNGCDVFALASSPPLKAWH